MSCRVGCVYGMMERVDIEEQQLSRLDREWQKWRWMMTEMTDDEAYVKATAMWQRTG